MKIRTKIKICGITNVDDALMCAAYGVDALGLVFYPKSPRLIDVDTANKIIDQLPPFMTVVGLFMNATEQDVDTVLSHCRLDRLQFHGSESATFCEQFSLPYYKAIAMADDDHNFSDLTRTYTRASAFLLDSNRSDQAGGSGQTFDWFKAPENSHKPLILAGGLTPDNVQSGIEVIRPYAVDCSSGVELKPGLKDPQKVGQFVEKVLNVSPTQ